MPKIDEMGPVDYVVVEFPAGTRDFGSALARELSSLVDAEMVRVLDILIIDKDRDGNVEAFEIDHLGHRDALRRVEAGLTEILAASDVQRVAEAVAPGSTAGVLVWENVWAAPFAEAARESGGMLVATGRISPQALRTSLARPGRGGS